MLDIQFIRDNPDKVADNAKQKGYEVDINQLLGFDKERRELISQTENLRRERNELTAKTKGQKPEEQQMEAGRQLKDKLSKTEHQLASIELELAELLKQVPNVIPDDTPQGGEENNKEERKWGEPRQDNVTDHLKWGESRELIDFERGAKAAGNKFYYLKGDLVLLELAVFQYALNILVEQGFTPMSVPHLVNKKAIEGTGFLAKGEEDQIYKIEGEDLHLIATAEIPITAYHSGEILDEKKLPLLYVGLSPAYRKEAGAYGKHSKGLYRVHQFNKLELYVFCKPTESEDWHQKLVAIEEKLCQDLGIPYRLVRIAAGDLGLSAYKKYDIEYWSPVDKSYRELMSCSNVTDYQARRLGIRFKNTEGKTEFVHSLNGTAAAFSRLCIAMIENFQTNEGKVKVPEALRPYMNGRDEI
jgi:seryl-tRNA synthetase